MHELRIEAKSLTNEAFGSANLISSDSGNRREESVVDEETRLVVAEGEDVPAEVEREAAQVIAALELIASRMGLQAPHPATKRKVRGARTVSPDFVAELAASADSLPRLRTYGTFDPEKARLAIERRKARRLIAERVQMFLDMLNYTAEAEWAEVVGEALHTLGMASIIAERPEEGELAAHVELLRKHLGRSNQWKGTKGKKK
jgi:hypothetical protein